MSIIVSYRFQNFGKIFKIIINTFTTTTKSHEITVISYLLLEDYKFNSYDYSLPWQCLITF